MALDPNYILASDLMGVFVDKDTALPLAGGVITFYSDDSRITLKSVYQLTGSASAPVYAALPNPLVLGIDGAYQDALGNSIVPYWKPFNDDGEAELYYVTVYSSGGVLQFTRVAWPNFTSNDFSEADITNYIPNGQFLAHNNHPITTSGGGVTTTFIAQGGWTTEISTVGGGTYTATFTRLQSGASWLNDFPRYLLNFACTAYGLESKRDLRIKWNDVNQFEGAETGGLGNQQYTLFFAARAQSVATTFNVFIIKYFGTGGSPNATEEIPVGTGAYTVNTNSSYFNISFSFGSNLGKTVGTNNDDYVQIAIRPAGGSFNIDFTDFALLLGTQSLQSFPVMTNARMLSEGVTGWMPTPAGDGSDLYLPLILTPQGVTFDHSIVGQIIGKPQFTPIYNELLMDGSAYVGTAYNSVTGIPYSRLRDFLLLNSPGIGINNGVSVGLSTIGAGKIPLWGTGAAFVTVLANPTAGQFDVTMNTTSGGNTFTLATAVPTGFTFVYNVDPLRIIAIPGVPAVSTYFSFSPAGSGLTYNVYFSVDGVSTPPATPSGANIEVPLVTGDTIATTRDKILQYVNKYSFLIVDATGAFWRGLALNGTRDTDYATRFVAGILAGAFPATGSGLLGSYELAAYLSHTHTLGGVNGVASAPAFVSTLATSTPSGGNVPMGSSGGTETRPLNFALNWFIKY